MKKLNNKKKLALGSITGILGSMGLILLADA